MLREPHENVATVLVDPALLRDLESGLMEPGPVGLAGPHRADLRRRPAGGVPAAPADGRGPARSLGLCRALGPGVDQASASGGGTAPSRCRGPPTGRCGTCSTRMPSRSASGAGSAACSRSSPRSSGRPADSRRRT
ncbi:hypothetical protein [Nocardioides convexus]|uniref:hypothetical protein n=1 Tax=Nocardioides convexus TaxID=2712224 RepID=UPI0024185B00|nr:hypothetical protein [Nocardioides convexus]